MEITQTQTIKEKLEELRRESMKRPAKVKRASIPKEPTVEDIESGVSFECPNAICQAQAFRLSKYREKRVSVHDRISMKWRNTAFYYKQKCKHLEKIVYTLYRKVNPRED